MYYTIIQKNIKHALGIRLKIKPAEPKVKGAIDLINRAFRNFYWGFLFVMVDFRLNGFDVLPDIIGYILFVAGLNLLWETHQQIFTKARTYHIIMAFLSVFSIYERPNQNMEGIHFGPLGFLIGIVILIFSLLAIYHLFMSIKEFAQELSAPDISAEAEERWKQFLYFQIAAFAAFLLILIPPIAFVYIIVMLVVSIILTIRFMGFMNRCGERLGSL